MGLADDGSDRDVVVLERARGLPQREAHEVLVPGKEVRAQTNRVSAITMPATTNTMITACITIQERGMERMSSGYRQPIGNT